MPTEQVEAIAPAGDGHAPGRYADALEELATAKPRKRRGRVAFWLAAGWLAIVVFVAVFADVLPLFGYEGIHPDVPARTAPRFSFTEPLGTDGIGRSMASRLAYGARQSLLIGLIAVSVAMSLGLLIGLAAGYLRGKVDEVISIFLDAVLSIPGLVFLTAVAAVGQRNVQTVIIGLSIVSTPTFSRLSRANTLALADREYVVAARAMGATNWRIMTREILPNVIFPVSSWAFLVLGTVMVAEGSLSFLGLGIPPPKPSWGGMVNDGRQFLATNAYLVFIPAACLLFTVLSFTIVGDRARRHFDTRESALS